MLDTSHRCIQPRPFATGVAALHASYLSSTDNSSKHTNNSITPWMCQELEGSNRGRAHTSASNTNLFCPILCSSRAKQWLPPFQALRQALAMPGHLGSCPHQPRRSLLWSSFCQQFHPMLTIMALLTLALLIAGIARLRPLHTPSPASSLEEGGSTIDSMAQPPSARQMQR